MLFDRRRRVSAAGLALALALASLVGATTSASASTATPWVSSVSPTAGKTAGGTRVTVNGMHFLHVHAVLFGTTRGTNLRVLSSTRLQVTAPAHSAGIVHVRVQTYVGISTTHSTDRFTFVAPPRISSVTPSRGSTSGGVRLTIRGSNFVHVTKVLFGSAPGTSIRVLSSSSLQVTGPAHTAGTVSIRVQTAYGLSPAVTADAFTYVAPPAISSLSPARGSVNGGTQVTISGSGFSGASQVMFGSTPVTSFTVDSDIQVEATAPPHAAASVDVKVTTPYGTSSTVMADQFTYLGPPTIAYLAGITSSGTAGGAVVDIYGQNFVGTPAVTFDGIPATNVVPMNISAQGVANYLEATAPAHPGVGPIDVRVTTPYGTSSTSPSDKFIYRPASSISWDAPKQIDPTRGEGVDTVSCPTSTFCLSLDRGGNVFTYDGSKWTSPTKTAPAGLNYVSCLSSIDCVAVGWKNEVSTFNGATWSTPVTVGSSTEYAVGISCGSSTFCMLVDEDGNTVAFDPTTDTTLSASSTGYSSPAGISCLSDTHCVVVDQWGIALTFNGSYWSTGVMIDPNQNAGIESSSCPTATFCVAVGASGKAWTFDGTNWSTATSIDTVPLTGVSCGTPTSCVAIDQHGRTVMYNGSDWATPTAGSNQNLSPYSPIWTISCASTTFCGAAELHGDAATFDGASLTYTHDVDPLNFFTGVSCPSTTFCVVVDYAGDAVTLSGTTWSAPTVADPLGEIEAVSCPSTSFCVAADTHGDVVTYDGTQWSTPVNLVTPGNLLLQMRISCTSPTFCLAADQTGDIEQFNGATWSAPFNIDPGTKSLAALSCATPTLCVAAAGNGVMSFNGSNWSAPDVAAVPRGVASISCVAPAFCGATDSYSGAAVFNGTSWSDDEDVSFEYYPYPSRLGAVSCTSATFCAASDGSTYDGTVWSTPNPAPNSDEAISCASPNFCVVLDSSGNAIVGE